MRTIFFNTWLQYRPWPLLISTEYAIFTQWRETNSKSKLKRIWHHWVKIRYSVLIKITYSVLIKITYSVLIKITYSVLIDIDITSEKSWTVNGWGVLCFNVDLARVYTEEEKIDSIVHLKKCAAGFIKIELSAYWLLLNILNSKSKGVA